MIRDIALNEIPFGEEYKKVKDFQLKKTIKYLIASLITTLSIYAVEFLEIASNILRGTKGKYIEYVLLIGLIVGVVMFGRAGFRSLYLYIKYRDIAKDVHNIGMSLIEALIHIGSVKTRRKDLVVAGTH